MKSLLLNGIGFVTGDPSLLLSNSFFSHPTIQIRTTTPGDLKWVSLMLPLHKGDIIKAINITYKNTSKVSFISQVRLAEYTNLIGAIVRHDDGTDLLSTVATIASSPVAGVSVKGSMLLNLRLNFGNTADMIEIGAIEIVYQPVA